MIIESSELNGIKYTVLLVDGIYKIELDLGYGPYEIDEAQAREVFAEDQYSVEAAVVRAIDNHRKESKARSSKELKDALKSVGEHDLGKSYYSVRLDNRLLIEMKARELNITKFINLAIAEKLTREWDLIIIKKRNNARRSRYE